MVLYNNQVVLTPSKDEEKRDDGSVNSEQKVQLFNPAFKHLTGIDLSTNKPLLDPEIFSELGTDSLDSKIFLVKTFDCE